MARYRIVQRGSVVQAGVAVFDVEERCWFWWEPRGIFSNLAEAERRVAELKAALPVKNMVIKEYD